MGQTDKMDSAMQDATRIAEILRQRGYQPEFHWVKRRHSCGGSSPGGTRDDAQTCSDAAEDFAHLYGSGDGEEVAPMSAAARKREQRKRASRSGWKEVTVKAPNTRDARDLVAEFARIIFDTETHALMRLAIANPTLIRLGMRVDKVKGLRLVLVNWLIR